MATLLVTSLRPGDGKTAFCAGLFHLLSGRGANPLLIKPVVIAEGEAAGSGDTDAGLFARLQDASQSQEQPITIDAGEARAYRPLPWRRPGRWLRVRPGRPMT